MPEPWGGSKATSKDHLGVVPVPELAARSSDVPDVGRLYRAQAQERSSDGNTQKDMGRLTGSGA